MTVLSTATSLESNRSQGASLRRGLRARMAVFVLGVAICDALVLSTAAFIGWRLRHVLNSYFDVSVQGRVVTVQAAIVVAVWMVVLVSQKVYSRDVFSVGYGEYNLVARASVLAMGCIGFYAYFTKTYIPRGFLAFTLILGLPLLLVVRFIARNVLSSLRSRGYLRHRSILVGSPAAVSELLKVFGRETWTGYSVLGVCVPEDAHDSWSHDVPVLGILGDVAEVVRKENADTVVMAGGTHSSPHDLRRLGWALEGLTVDMLVAPTLTDVAGPRIRMRNVAGLPLVHVAQPSFTEARGPLKRLFDVVVSSVLLFFMTPLLLVVAAAIKLQDRGPVFFRQTRVGVLGNEFSMIKFRSMVPDAHLARAELAEHNEHDGVLFKIKDDPRVTRVGRFIRRYSIDELPQLFNVLKGEMSLVGPRPALPKEVDRYGDDMRRRLLVQPGLTGLWQVSGRSDLSWEDSVRLDLYYVDNWSMVGDLVILGKTARAVLSSGGAY